MGFEVERIEPLRLKGPAALTEQELLSPYVWRGTDGALKMLVRAAPQPWRSHRTTGRIWLAEGDDDGLGFVADPAPLISPGPGPYDIGGCEDPTLVRGADECIVYYTGLDALGAGQMLCATGPDVRHLEKRGIALASSKTERNTKEATVERMQGGDWHLLYEYSRDNRSRIGLAVGPGPRGPWREERDPFTTRANRWDSWHLSTGPIIMTDPEAPVMFYNGADRDAVWGIGWVVFSERYQQVVARSAAPLIAPPSRPEGGRDIVFAASAVEHGERIWLYFSQNDRSLHRAVIRRTGREQKRIFPQAPQPVRKPRG